MGVVRTKSGLASTTRTTRDQLIIFIDIITKNHFLEGRRRDWSESDSSIQPLYCKFHALCLPVGGASLANDDVMRGGGAAEIGMWRKQVQWSVAVVVATDSVIHAHKRPSLDQLSALAQPIIKFQFSKGSPPPTHWLHTPTTPTITHIHTTPRTPSQTRYWFGGTCER